MRAQARWLSWLEHHPMHQKIVSSIPGQGKYLGWKYIIKSWFGKDCSSFCLIITIHFQNCPGLKYTVYGHLTHTFGKELKTWPERSLDRCMRYTYECESRWGVVGWGRGNGGKWWNSISGSVLSH